MRRRRVRIPEAWLNAFVDRALQEDIGRGDVTAACVPVGTIRARLVAREAGVVAGGALVQRVFRRIGRGCRCRMVTPDGRRVRAGSVVAWVEGPAQAVLAAERTALNILGRLSGIATLTRRFADAVCGTRVAILDTRKTTPGWRALEKAAVTAGGGRNHRMGLDDAVLLKRNHLRAASHRSGEGGCVLRGLVREARARFPRVFLEVEVATLQEFRWALAERPDAILLDNMRLRQVRAAVRRRNLMARAWGRAPLLEVSGGVSLRTVRRLARTGVERISVGALTHSPTCLDVALEVIWMRTGSPSSRS